jgi:hypothetical protein
VKVRELLVVLAHVDPDLDVHVSSTWGSHLGTVRVQTRRSAKDVRHWLALHGPQVLEPYLDLAGEAPWYKPAPAWELRGRFRDRAGLDRALGAIDGEPA